MSKRLFLVSLSLASLTFLSYSCSATQILDKEKIVVFNELPDLLKEKLEENYLSGYEKPLVLNLDSSNVSFRHRQKRMGAFAGDHYFFIEKKKFVLNLNNGYDPFILYEKKLFCLEKPMGLPRIRNLEKSKFNVYDLKNEVRY